MKEEKMTENRSKFVTLVKAGSGEKATNVSYKRKL